MQNYSIYIPPAASPVKIGIDFIDNVWSAPKEVYGGDLQTHLVE